ncbi:hypothetical protein D3C81_1842110 [compost metagenome]
MGIICIGNSHQALFKEKPLASHIFFKILVFIRTDMIRLNICKDTVIKGKAANS